MLTNIKFTVLKAGLLALALSVGACGSSKPSAVTGSGGHGGSSAAGGSGAGGSSAGGSSAGGSSAGGSSAGGSTAAAGSDGGAAGTSGSDAAPTEGGAADGGTDAALTPAQVNTQLLNDTTTTPGVMITRAAPKVYAAGVCN